MCDGNHLFPEQLLDVLNIYLCQKCSVQVSMSLFPLLSHMKEKKKKTKPLLLVVQILEITQVWLNLEFSSDNNLN